MRNLFIITSFIFLLASCSSTDNSNASVTNVDSTEMLRNTKEGDEIFSPFALDSIYKKLQASPLGALPKEWEMLTEKNKELIVLIPGGGDNHRFFIVATDSIFMLRLNGMHDAVEYLITDCTQNGNETIITYYATSTWTYGNVFVQGVDNRTPLYSKLVMKEAKQKPGNVKCNYPNLILCNYPKDNTYYVNAEHVKDFPKEVEPNPYDEGVDLSVDSVGHAKK